MSACRRRRAAKVMALTASAAQQKTDMDMTLCIRWLGGGGTAAAAARPPPQLDVTLNRSKLTVTDVSEVSPLREFLFEGDQLLAVNGKDVKTTDDIRQQLRTNGRSTELAIRAARQSWTEHDPQDRLLVTSMTTLRADDDEDEDGGCSRLGMMLKDVGPVGVVVVALEQQQRRRLVRPIHVNDIVCRVNQQPVVSASQAKQLIKDSLLRLDSVRLLLARPIEERRSADVKAAVAQSYDYTKEPADDVKECCAEQLGLLERAPPAQPAPLSSVRFVLRCRSMLHVGGEKDDPNFEQDNASAQNEEPLSEFEATRTKKLNFAKFRRIPPVKMPVCAGWELIGRLLSETEAPRRRVHFPDCVRQRRDCQIGSDFEPNKQFRKTPQRGQWKTLRLLRQRQLQQLKQQQEQHQQEQQQEQHQQEQQQEQQQQDQDQQQEQQQNSSSSTKKV